MNAKSGFPLIALALMALPLNMSNAWTGDLPGQFSSSCTACNIYIPNAFSPNDDGRNDIFRPETNCEILEYELRIFNRWGDEVFSSQSIDQGWDGDYKGQDAPSDVYLFLLKYTYETGELTESEVKTGDLALLR